MSARLFRHSFNRLKCCQSVNVGFLQKHHSIHLQRHTLSSNITELQRFHSTSTSTLPNIHSSATAEKAPRTKTEEIYDALKVNMVKRKRVSSKAIKEFLRLSPAELTNEQLEFLLKCPSFVVDETLAKRGEILDSIWEKRIAQNTPEHLNVAYLEACRDVQKPVDLKPFLTEKCSQKIFEACFEVSCVLGNLDEANALLSQIEKAGSKIQERHFAYLLKCYAKSNQDFAEVLTQMNDLKIEKTSLTYLQLYEAYSLSQPKEAKNLLKEKILLFSPDQLATILVTALENKAELDMVNFILQHFPSETLTNHEMDPVLRNVCSELILKEKLEAIEALLKKLPTPKYSSSQGIDIYGVNILEEMLTKFQTADPVIKICETLIETGKNVRALHVALGLALKVNSTIAIPLLKSLKNKEPLRPHYFWPLLNQSSLVDGEVGVLETLQIMTKLNVEVDAETISLYVLPKLGITLKNSEKGVKELEQIGIKTSVLFTPLFCHLLFQQRYNEVLFLNSLYPTKLETETLVYPLTTTFTVQKGNQNFFQTFSRLLKSLSDKALNPKHDLIGNLVVDLSVNPKNKTDHRSILQLLQCLQQQKLKMSKRAVGIVQRHLEKFGAADEDTKKLLHELVDAEKSLPAAGAVENDMLKRPSDMNLEELECHLTELQSKRMNTRGVLRRLLQTCVREGKLDRALEIKNQCDVLKVEISPGMLACIFDLYVRTKNVEQAASSLRKLNLKYPGFLIDEHKIIDYAAVLIENGNIEDARKALRIRAQVAKIRGGENTNKNIWNLLNLLSSRAVAGTEVNETKEFFLFLHKLGYCTYTNSVLGPILKEFLAKNDLKSAVAEYKILCQNHRVTPLQRQIMTHLVDASNNEKVQQQFGVTQEEARTLLQEVVAATTGVHGAASTNIALIIAFADAGTEKQLRKMLIDPKVRISPEVLKKQCEYLNESKKMHALLKLARCCRGLGHFREQDVYNMVLDALIKENDCDAALNLFENLIGDDDFKVSSEFTNKLVDLLKKNNLEPPTSVVLYAK